MTDAAKTGTIHDLGYKRYVGTRRSAATRWLVIMRHQIAMGWKKWWRYKMALSFAVVTTFIAGALMYFATNKIVRKYGAAGGDYILKMADAVVPGSIEWYCRGAFILSLTLAATVVATDTQSGAFTFYYVRSIRPRDYVLGKLAGIGLLVGTIVIVPLVLLTGMRLGLATSTDEVLGLLPMFPKVIAIGVLATLVYTAVPLAISSLVANRRYALALWVSYYLIVGFISGNISLFVSPDAGVFDIQTSLQAVTYELFDMRLLRIKTGGLSPKLALYGLVAQSALSIAILWFQVSRDHRSGVGGSS
jgi:ABC-type transport system involved in multi-copper enzyme maturation permease subunit